MHIVDTLVARNLSVLRFEGFAVKPDVVKRIDYPSAGDIVAQRFCNGSVVRRRSGGHLNPLGILPTTMKPYAGVNISSKTKKPTSGMLLKALNPLVNPFLTQAVRICRCIDSLSPMITLSPSKWNLIKMENFPSNMSEVTYSNYLFRLLSAPRTIGKFLQVIDTHDYSLHDYGKASDVWYDVRGLGPYEKTSTLLAREYSSGSFRLFNYQAFCANLILLQEIYDQVRLDTEVNLGEVDSFYIPQFIPSFIPISSTHVQDEDLLSESMISLSDLPSLTTGALIPTTALFAARVNSFSSIDNAASEFWRGSSRSAQRIKEFLDFFFAALIYFKHSAGGWTSYSRLDADAIFRLYNLYVKSVPNENDVKINRFKVLLTGLASLGMRPPVSQEFEKNSIKAQNAFLKRQIFMFSSSQIYSDFILFPKNDRIEEDDFRDKPSLASEVQASYEFCNVLRPRLFQFSLYRLAEEGKKEEFSKRFFNYLTLLANSLPAAANAWKTILHRILRDGYGTGTILGSTIDKMMTFFN